MNFKGFPQDTLIFLQQLKHNNHRDWFSQNKERYESLIREPALVLIEAIGPELAKISPHFNAIAKKSGGSLMRVYRDTRFFKDKTPYKTNIGIQFRHKLGKDVHAPGFYLHIAPDECFLGVGLWRPEAKILAKIRTFIMDNPSAWKDANHYKPFKKYYQISGDSLKRPPRGFPADHELIEDLKRKDFIALKAFNPSRIHKPQFIKYVIDSYLQADPYMHYLCDAVDVQFRQ